MPTVTFKAEAVPIPGSAGTGNILGAGATLESEFKIKGSEYGGGPPPLLGVKVFLPVGTVLHTAGFPTCRRPLIEEGEPQKCPKRSAAGPPGEAKISVVLGDQRIPENLSIKGFYGTSGSLNFAVSGRSPVALKLVARGRYANLKGAGGSGPEAIFTMPLVSTIPGARDASTERIVTTLGSVIARRGKPIYSARMPHACPLKNLAFRAELTFAENGAATTPVTVPASYKAPCPRSRR